MPEVDTSVRELFRSLDRFLQWDLVTVTPWGAPSISPVGARLVPEESTVWTSTTVGYVAKIRNIQANSKVALMRTQVGESSVLVRGEARVVGGDGTLNLAQLFRLMGGAGGARRFFATSATDPFWSRLYRSYWHRFLIAVNIVEISTMGPNGWEAHKIASWNEPKATPAPPPGRLGRPSRPAGLVDQRGRAMLAAGTPSALATLRRNGVAPMVWPVLATPEPSGAIRIAAGSDFPAGRLPHTSLAVRVIDDSFESAQMVGWIGTLEAGRGERRLVPRGAYGFTKPPGVIGDFAAGVAALIREAGLRRPPRVSSPDMARAAALGGSEPAPKLELPESAWKLLEQIFARRNAAAPWYAGMAAVISDRRLQGSLAVLAERAQLERDWAQGLLARGARRVGASRLAAGALALRPNPAAPGATVAREEARIAQLISRLLEQLPSGVGAPPGRVAGNFRTGPGPVTRRARDQRLSEVTLTTATSLAAALDRLKERRPE